MSDHNELRHKETWTTTYRGIAIEIAKWFMDGLRSGPTPVWNYYLLIHEQSVPYDQRSRIFLKGKWERLFGSRPRLTYNYMSCGALCNLTWHGGITLYDIEGGMHGAPRIVRAGCDYHHLWDEGLESSYDVAQVLQDARNTADGLREAMPSLRYWCSYLGTWHDESDGLINEDGTFMSNEGLAKAATAKAK